jgi:hypothetical protein
MQISVQIESASGAPPELEYRWDPDTEILTATVHEGATGRTEEGLSGSVDVQGADGSWLVLDVAGGGIRGVEVAVWPELRTIDRLAPPAAVEYSRVTLPAGASNDGIAALEVDDALVAETDEEERTIHFRIGTARHARTVRLARDLLLDLDPRNQIAGVWLLNVPPLPGVS